MYIIEFMSKILNKFFGFFKSKWVLGILFLAIIFGGYWFFLRSSTAQYQFITVTRGSIIETVSVTGNTVPTKSVSLGFQNTGTIAQVNYNLGDQVSAGAVIAELNIGNLSAALQQAKASLSAAEADLAALTAGTRPEQINIYRNNVVQSQATLANAIARAYAVADGAVHTDADQFFTNPRNTNPDITFILPDAILKNTVVLERAAIEPMLIAWNTQISSPSFGSSNLIADTTTATQNLTQIITFLNDVATALANEIGLSETSVASYTSSITTARTNVAAALTALTNAKTALLNDQGTLALAEAGSTSQSIAAGQAQVQQAQAGVANAQANLQGARIIAPISGVVTELDAKIGQLATPGTPLVSIIGNGGFQVEAGVSETDVGKLAVGNIVTMTLDAFPKETFTGSVFYIAPAQTDTQGVISYLTKIAFDKPDSRIKSGLTANIDIQTRRHDSVLILPQYAILQDDLGTFVEILVGKTATTSPVTLGMQDQNGNVEILSGVSDGEQVINIGLKSTK